MNYYEIKTKSFIANEVLNMAYLPGDWYHYYNFIARPVPNELLLLDPLCKWLATKYNFIGGILRMDPYTCYDWHKDTRRGVGINMLLTPFMRSSCTFATNRDEQVFKVDELPYKPITYYVFNTQVEHMVNNYEATRYLFSIEFELDKDKLSFEDLVKDIKDNYERT